MEYEDWTIKVFYFKCRWKRQNYWLRFFFAVLKHLKYSNTQIVALISDKTESVIFSERFISIKHWGKNKNLLQRLIVHQ